MNWVKTTWACLKSIHESAVPYQIRVCYDDAELLLLEAGYGRRLKLGDTHPHTLESLNNLINLYEAWDKRDGLKSRCKACDSTYARDPRWRKRNIREYLGFELQHRIIQGVREKLCSRRKQWKDEDGFYRSRGAKDGLAGWCKECEMRRSHERYERNRKGKRRLHP